MDTAREAAQPGWDPQTGAGVLDISRALQAGVPGHYNLAVTGHVISVKQSSTAGLWVDVVVQNGGTESVDDVHLQTLTGGQVSEHFLGTLQPGGVGTAPVWVQRPADGHEVTLQSRVYSPATTHMETDLQDNVRGDRWRALPR